MSKLSSALKGNTKLWNILLLGIPLIFLCLLPQFAKNNYIVSVGVTFCTMACWGVAWNIVGGYAEQISWCHASFVAIGAYTSFLLYIHFGISPWLGMLIGAAISVLAAFIIGVISFRLRGIFFSLSTIAFSEIVRVLLMYKKDITKGANGLVVTYKQDSFINLTFSSDRYYYYILLVFLIVIVFISWQIGRSKIGYYLRAIKADEDAAMSIGIETHNVKLIAFLISAALTSMVGTIFAFFLTYIDPSSTCGLDLSTKIGSMAIVGGLGTLAGPILGAAVLVPLAEVANRLLGASGSGMLLYGALLIIVLIFRPGGIRSFFVKGESKRTLSPLKKKSR